MRPPLVFLAALAAASLTPAVPAEASTPAERLLKRASKYAVHQDMVFTAELKPRHLCYCRSGSAVLKVGFLVYNDVHAFLCGVPTDFVNGNVSAIDYGCEDFQVLDR